VPLLDLGDLGRVRRYADTPIRVNAFTSTWTARAVELAWLTPTGDTHRAWVWANPVQRRVLSTDEKLGGFPSLR